MPAEQNCTALIAAVVGALVNVAAEGSHTVPPAKRTFLGSTVKVER